jgi:type VI secretion system protein ImpG
MDNELLLQYQQELSFIRKIGDQFAIAHPKIAGHLRSGSKAVEDPHVARLIEAFALFNARIQNKIAYDTPEISNAFLNLLYPDYLAPIPSMSLVQFQTDNHKCPYKKIIPADTLITSDKDHGEVCYFTTRSIANHSQHLLFPN